MCCVAINILPNVVCFPVAMETKVFDTFKDFQHIELELPHLKQPTYFRNVG